MVTAVAFVLVAGLAAAVRLAAREIVPGPVWFPLGTLVVNLAGAFALGLVSAWSAPVVTVVATAGLGALTTFSTLSSEVVAGWTTNRAATAGYLLVTLAGGVALAWCGLELAG